MNRFADPFKQLVERRLWPAAVLLVAALAAIPLLLAKDPEEPVVPTATATAPTEPADASVVTLADADERDRVRAVLGSRKDPFRPAQLRRVPKADTSADSAQASAPAGPGTAADGATATSVGGATGGGTTTTTPAPATTPAPEKPTYDLYSLKVRFGPTDGDLVTRNVKRLTGLPRGTRPAALYLGLLGDRETAVFIIDAGVEVLGDGRCEPSPEDCQTLTLKKGETQFLTRGEKQWQLDLVDIHVKKTTDAGAARLSRKAVAADGRRSLKRLRGRSAGFAYDEAQGSLKRVTRSARTAEAARGAGGVAAFDTSG